MFDVLSFIPREKSYPLVFGRKKQDYIFKFLTYITERVLK
jgi:hypothetical protein